MDERETPTPREYLPWSVLFGIVGVASGIAESAWLQLRPQFSILIPVVLFTLGWGFGFDVAKRRRIPQSKTHHLIFAAISALLFILVAAMCGGAGVVINGQIAPRAP